MTSILFPVLENEYGFFYSYLHSPVHKPVLYRSVRKKGDGNMANSLTFHVDESVWFKSGDEIKNILSLSIEPEIEISETENEVTMTGALRVDGEYERFDEQVEREHEQTAEPASVRYVQEVRQINDQFVQFLHRFPVEITIPKERISDRNEVNVTVATFDYRLPESNCLQLSAELVIHGIQSAEDQELQNYDFEERVKEIYSANQASFSINSKIDETKVDNAEEATANAGDETAAREEPAQSGPQIELKSRSEESEEDQVETERLEEAEEEDARIEDEVNQDSDVSEEENEPELKKEKRSETRPENALYLTKMLSRSEEQFSKLKMRIIQPGDSLESIARAYQVQPTQIARLNQLDDEQIEEGQILYIPVKAKQER